MRRSRPTLFLFGSRAKGNPRPGSDWDFFVLLNPVPTEKEFLRGTGLEEFEEMVRRMRGLLGKGAVLHPFVVVRVDGGYTLVGPDRDEPLEPWLVPDRIPKVWGSIEEMVRELGAKIWEEVS